MQGLTIEQIEIITADVTAGGITFSHLHEDLVDHICCMVEEGLNNGLSFEAAYSKVKQMYGTKGLKKVQEDTILLIDKKYRIMKKSMNIVGMVSLAMITIGALFKIQHWPGAGILLVLGFTFLGVVFMPVALWVAKKESKLKGPVFIYIISVIGSLPFIFGFLFKIQHWPGAGIMLTIGFSILAGILLPTILIMKLIDPDSKHMRLTYIIGYLALSNYLIGSLFKIQHWPGAGVMLIFGAIVLTAVFFPMYVTKVYKKAESVKAGFLFLCTGMVFFNMFNLLLAVNVSKDVLSNFINPGRDIIKTENILDTKCQMLTENLINDTLNADTLFFTRISRIKAVADEVCDYMENCKAEIIVRVDGISHSEALKRAQDPALIITKDNYDIPTRWLCGTAPDFNDGKGTVIRQKISACRDIFIGICNENKQVCDIFSKTLNTDSVYTENEPKKFSWEFHQFYHQLAVATVNKLSLLQFKVRLAELITLEYLTDNKSNKH